MRPFIGKSFGIISVLQINKYTVTIKPISNKKTAQVEIILNKTARNAHARAGRGGGVTDPNVQKSHASTA